MSTKELAYSLVDSLDEQQLNALIILLQGITGVGAAEEVVPDEQK